MRERRGRINQETKDNRKKEERRKEKEGKGKVMRSKK